MAIFGNLADMPTLEVLRMLGPRTGKLYLRPTLTKQYELHLHEGAIFCFRVAGFSVRDSAQLRRDVTELFRLRRGEFEFEAAPLSGLEHEVTLSRQDVWGLAAALEVGADSTDADSAHTETVAAEPPPDQETRFRLRPGAAADFELPDNLKTFLRRAHGLLSAGGNALELAAALDLHPSVVKLYLMRLRTLGKITPVRAYTANYEGYSAAPPVTPPALTASGVTTVMTTTTTTTTTTMTATAMATALLTPTHTERPEVAAPAPGAARPALQKSLIRRLLSAFSFGGR